MARSERLTGETDRSATRHQQYSYLLTVYPTSSRGARRWGVQTTPTISISPTEIKINIRITYRILKDLRFVFNRAATLLTVHVVVSSVCGEHLMAADVGL